MTNEVMLSKLGFISIFPEMVSAITDWGVTGRACLLYTSDADDE